jgi:opacity protein-like surface antigen
MRRLRVGFMVLGCLAALAPAGARAQMYETETGVAGPLVWNIGGTLAVPLGKSADRTDVGGGFTLGLTYNPAMWGGVQFEYGAAWSNLKNTSGLAQIAGHGFLQYFDLNLLVHPVHHQRGVGFYLVGGGGLYYRSVTVTKYEGTTLAPYCDPWLYYCSAVPVSASSVLGSRSSWDWGLDAGAGITFAVSPAARLYFEVRYHYIFGPSFTNSNGSTTHADGQYLPLTLGVRF